MQARRAALAAPLVVSLWLLAGGLIVRGADARCVSSAAATVLAVPTAILSLGSGAASTPAPSPTPNDDNDNDNDDDNDDDGDDCPAPAAPTPSPSPAAPPPAADPPLVFPDVPRPKIPAEAMYAIVFGGIALLAFLLCLAPRAHRLACRATDAAWTRWNLRQDARDLADAPRRAAERARVVAEIERVAAEIERDGRAQRELEAGRSGRHCFELEGVEVRNPVGEAAAATTTPGSNKEQQQQQQRPPTVVTGLRIPLPITLNPPPRVVFEQHAMSPQPSAATVDGAESGDV
jgi:hypothetical protein